MEINKKSDLIRCSLFLLLISIPFITFIFGPESRSNSSQNRELALPPVVKLKLNSLCAFPDNFEKYYDDHFGFRELLIKAHSIIRLKIFNVSSSRKVVLGNQEWLYLTDTVNLHDTKKLFTSDELEKWRLYLLARSNLCKKKGIPYFFFIAPNKASIYPEYLPEKYDRIQTNSFFTQLVDYMRTTSGFEVIDLRDVLRSQKGQHQLYQRTDNHWNQIGCYFAYKKIASTLNRFNLNVKPIPLSFFELVYKEESGSLSFMLGCGEILKDWDVYLRPKSFQFGKREIVTPFFNRKMPNRWQSPFSIRNHNKAKGKLLALGDSFLMGDKSLLPYLFGVHFEKSVFLHRDSVNRSMLSQMIDKERPDVLIEEIAERGIYPGPDVITQQIRSNIVGRRFKLLKDSLFIITHNHLPKDIKTAPFMELKRRSTGTVLSILKKGAYILMPQIALSNHLKYVIRVETSSPQNTTLGLYYQTLTKPYFTEKQKLNTYVSPGRNEIYLYLAVDGFNGMLRLAPGLATGDYVLHGFEIRGE